jgi:hypothetical protein
LEELARRCVVPARRMCRGRRAGRQPEWGTRCARNRRVTIALARPISSRYR